MLLLNTSVTLSGFLILKTSAFFFTPEGAPKVLSSFNELEVLNEL
jgi:hypothetical protein